MSACSTTQLYIFKYCSIFFPALFKFSNTGRPLQLQEQPARNLHSTTARRFCTGHIPGLQCWTFSFEYCRLYPAAMTDKEHLCDLHDDNDFKETKWPRGVGRHPTKRRAKGRANSQASDRAQAGSTEHSDTEQTMENKRKPSTKHNWIACKDDAGVGPRIFQGFAAAYAYMHLTFAVAVARAWHLLTKVVIPLSTASSTGMHARSTTTSGAPSSCASVFWYAPLPLPERFAFSCSRQTVSHTRHCAICGDNHPSRHSLSPFLVVPSL